MPASLPVPTSKRTHFPVAATPSPIDSGYASRDEGESANDVAAAEEVIATVRADAFERTFAARWLTSLISRVEETAFEEDVKSQIVDDAAFILSSFSDSTNDPEEEALTRDFSFPTACGNPIHVTLNDAPLSGTDHTDVGLQSWGASIILSSMMCADPERFDISSNKNPSIIELGAGTGLVSLTLAKILPQVGVQDSHIAATDYHPAVLNNCNTNIAMNFPTDNEIPRISTMLLDWSQPPPDLYHTFDLLIASDVVYAPEHATWLRDCAAHLLKPNGTFWLMVTVRKTGKFEGIPDTVESAFTPELCPKDANGRSFTILRKEGVEKRRGIGRGDESGYNLFRISWA